MASCSDLPAPFRHAAVEADVDFLGNITLPDGRVLAFRAYGKGFPVVFVPGQFNSRLFEPAWGESHAIATSAGARVIQIDRPGYGASSGPPSRTYTSFAKDVAFLLESLRLREVIVMGYSSGGPYALGISAFLGRQRVRRTCLISADGPYCLGALRAERLHVYKKEEPLSFSQALLHVQDFGTRLRESYTQVKDAGKRQSCLHDYDEAMRQGLDAAAQDSVNETNPWDFDLGDVGDIVFFCTPDDVVVPASVSEHVATLVGGPVEMVMVEKENHSMIKRIFARILASALQTPQLGKPAGSSGRM